MTSIEELKKDVEELKVLQNQATRSKIKDILLVAQRKIETDILDLQEKQKQHEGDSGANKTIPSANSNKRYVTELTEYAWDQSDKFVKLFITADGIQNLSESDIDSTFTENSFKLNIHNLKNKDYCLTINNLLSSIDVEKSYHKIKTDMIAIYMKKQNEGQTWSHLTATEKRLKDLKDSALKGDDGDELKDDPTDGLINLMKRMYENGDPEMKKIIAKAWTENEAKMGNGPR